MIKVRVKILIRFVKNFSMDYMDQIAQLLKPRPEDAFKNIFGHALLIAGQKGMAGAGILAAKACMKSGCGLLSVRVPECNRVIMQISVPEAMVLTDNSDECFTTPVNTEKYQAVGIGPGLGQSSHTKNALEMQLEQIRVPLVLDADALNIISANPQLWEHVPYGTIITPHAGELDRLTGIKACNFEQRLDNAETLAAEHSVIVVMKGAPTRIITPSGNCFANTTGNQGMATAGSGDVLTGVILSLLAQGYDNESAARIGVFVHGLSGDIAARRKGMTGMTSCDIAEALPEAWMQITQQKSFQIRP